MSNNKKKTWATKYGPRRVRHEAPTLVEAIVAAQGLSDQVDEQVEIAASLIGLPADQVRKELLKLGSPRRDTAAMSIVFSNRQSAPRAVVVERKASRRFVATAKGAAAPAVRASLRSSLLGGRDNALRGD